MNTKSCAAQHFGPWMVDHKWFTQAVEAVRSGQWKPKQSKDEGGDEKKLPLVAEIGDEYGTDDECGYEIRNGVAIIEIVGHMTRYGSSFGGCSTIEVRRAVRNAANDRFVKQILLYIDSPGGTCAGTSDLGKDVLAASKVKPTWAFIANCGASAAYWVASQTSKIWCNDTAMVGSIGTYAMLMDDTKWQEEIGIKYTLVSTGKYKGLGADGKVSAELTSDVQREVDELNEPFLMSVAAGRGMDDTEVRALADGRVHVGDNAKSLGLVDEVGTLDQALEALINEESFMVNYDQFKAYAKEHPDHLQEVAQPLITSAVDKAVKDATKPEPAATVNQLKEAFSDSNFIIDQLGAGASLTQAKLNWSDKLKKDVEALKQENSQLKTDLAKADPSTAGRSEPLNVEDPKKDGEPKPMTAERKKQLLEMSR